MIDNIKLYFAAHQFNGNFSNCVLIEKKETRNEWRLNNPHNNSHISIWEHFNGVLTIKGSIRKWQLGKYSIEDLTLSSFSNATKQIAELLGISWDNLCSVSATQIEFGFNIPISIPYSLFHKKIVSYATHRNNVIRGKGRTVNNYGTIYFGKRECDFRLKIYDKGKEIQDNTDFIDEVGLSDSHPNIIRIEFTADDKKSFTRKGLAKIASINDLIENWENIRELWAYEVGRITLQNVISDTSDLSLNDILCSEALNLYLWTDSIKILEEHITEQYHTKKSVTTAKTKLYARINYLFDNYSDKNDFRKIDFYKDIIRYFADINSNEEQINLVRIWAMLHSHTCYAGIEHE